MYKDVNKLVAIHIYVVIDISELQIRMFPLNGFSSVRRENVASRVKVFFKAMTFVPIVFFFISGLINSAITTTFERSVRCRRPSCQRLGKRKPALFCSEVLSF